MKIVQFRLFSLLTLGVVACTEDVPRDTDVAAGQNGEDATSQADVDALSADADAAADLPPTDVFVDPNDELGLLRAPEGSTGKCKEFGVKPQEFATPMDTTDPANDLPKTAKTTPPTFAFTGKFELYHRLQDTVQVVTAEDCKQILAWAKTPPGNQPVNWLVGGDGKFVVGLEYLRPGYDPAATFPADPAKKNAIACTGAEGHPSLAALANPAGYARNAGDLKWDAANANLVLTTCSGRYGHGRTQAEASASAKRLNAICDAAGAPLHVVGLVCPP